MESDRAFVVMIDMQERLAPRIEGIKEIVDNSKKLLKASKIFGIPIIAMDMIEDFEVYVAVDCTGSRRRFDKEVALQRMSSKGVVLTTAETAIYELLESAENEKFREILSIVKGE